MVKKKIHTKVGQNNKGEDTPIIKAENESIKTTAIEGPTEQQIEQILLEEKDVASTVEFVLGKNPGESKGIIEEMQEKLSLAINKSKNEELSGSILIKSDYADDHNEMADYAGIEKAFDLIIQDPEKKVILMDAYINNIDDYKNYKEISYAYEEFKDKLQILKQAKNFRFFHFSSCDFINAVKLNKLFREDNQETISLNQNIRETLKKVDNETSLKNTEDMIKLRGFDPLITVQQMSFEAKRLELGKARLGYEEPEVMEVKITIWESDEAFQHIVQNQIVHFLHNRSNREHMLSDKSRKYEEDLPKLFNLPEEKKSSDWIDFEDKLIALLHIQHPSFKLLPKKNNLQWIVDTFKYVNTKLVHEGERFEGIFVDRDGTLYDNKNQKFNQKVIDMIKEYESQGKKIIIWSGGNLEMKQDLLDSNPQLHHYKIQNKTDYKGGTVEMAIDNDDSDILWANAKIKTEYLIKV